MAGDYILEIKLPNGSWKRVYAVPVPSYLELKGALACLGGALTACLRNLYDTHDHASYNEARSILSTAQDAVRAELGAL